MNDIKAKLIQLKELDRRLEIISNDKDVVIDSILTKEIKDQLEAVDQEFDEKWTVLKDEANKLELEIREEVLMTGIGLKKTVDNYGVFFVKGRVSWNVKALEGYAIAHPEIDKFKKVGKPSVRINKKSK